MLFRLKLAEGAVKEGRTTLGYNWIEVIQALPWWLTEVVGDDGERRGWRIDSHYLCRTEHGIVWLPQGDLDPEIEEGVYVEEPHPHLPVGTVVCTKCKENAVSRCNGCLKPMCVDHLMANVNTGIWYCRQCARELDAKASPPQSQE